jgi:hypothetical protein
MSVHKDYITSRKKGFFSAHFRGIDTATYGVQFGKLEELPIRQELPFIHRRMTELYGFRYEIDPTPIRKVADEDTDIDEEGDY